ncbi:radical SAM protein [Candidatus Woesearchaeota archaeon]|nr:radical SAM protein [Candidatus Woesearchaeota archaeon]
MTYIKLRNGSYINFSYFLFQKIYHEQRINYIRIRKKFYDFFNKSGDKVLRPIVIWIEPTNNCNLKCIFCSHGNKSLTRKKGFMDYNLYKKIIDEVSVWRPSLYLHGIGEPLLHRKIIDMIKYARLKKCAFLHLTTNGMLLNDKLSEKLANSGLDFLRFSVDSISRDYHKRVKVNSDLDKVVSNIENFIKIKGENKAKRPQVGVSMVCTKENKNKIGPFIKKFKNIGVDFIFMNHIHNWAGLLGSNKLRVKRPNYICWHPWYFSTVTWDGYLLPCCHDANARYKIGNISKNKLLDVWDNNKMQFLRKCLKNGKSEKIPLCRNCDSLFVSNKE